MDKEDWRDRVEAGKKAVSVKTLRINWIIRTSALCTIYQMAPYVVTNLTITCEVRRIMYKNQSLVRIMRLTWRCFVLFCFSVKKNSRMPVSVYAFCLVLFLCVWMLPSLSAAWWTVFPCVWKLNGLSSQFAARSCLHTRRRKKPRRRRVGLKTSLKDNQKALEPMNPPRAWLANLWMMSQTKILRMIT